MVLMVASVHLPPPGAATAAASAAAATTPAGGGGGGAGEGGAAPVGVTVRSAASLHAVLPGQRTRFTSASVLVPRPRCEHTQSPQVARVLFTCPLPLSLCSQLVLTDGWYWLRATGDERLTRLARTGRIGPGAPRSRAVGGPTASFTACQPGWRGRLQTSASPDDACVCLAPHVAVPAPCRRQAAHLRRGAQLPGAGRPAGRRRHGCAGTAGAARVPAGSGTRDGLGSGQLRPFALPASR